MRDKSLLQHDIDGGFTQDIYARLMLPKMRLVNLNFHDVSDEVASVRQMAISVHLH
jgi:hypothetical protein